jgi:dipeptidyl aminopeptidase/acylaminoacyl peptidase
VAQAPVADLVAGIELSGGAVRELLGGGPDAYPERYAAADPVRLVGHGRPVLLVHGHADDTVPVTQSERYLDATREAGDPAELLVLPGGHFEVIDPTDPLWTGAVDFLAATC